MEPGDRRLYEVELDADALDCGVCFLPLKPPIFQCQVGHVVCSPCRDSLAAAGGKCHACDASTAGATPWSAWWSPSVCRAQTPLVAALRGRRTTTGTVTA
ncbi:hypothetical protein EJB05_33756, partial [Eragrostis curvula]